MPCALNSEHAQVEQRLAVALVQARGRLVEDQQPHALGEAPSRSRRAAACRRLEVGHQRGPRLARPTLASSSRVRRCASPQSMMPAASRALVAEEHVLGDRQQQDTQRELLVDDDDAARLRCRRCRRKRALLAVEADLARVAAVRVDAAQAPSSGSTCWRRSRRRSARISPALHDEVDVGRARRRQGRPCGCRASRGWSSRPPAGRRPASPRVARSR